MLLKGVRIIPVVLLMLVSAGCASLSPEQKAAREAQKAQEAKLEAMRHEQAVAALKNMDFVMEADRLTFKRGETFNVPSSINFIASSDGITTVQLGSYRGSGLNGVGGITVEGKATDVSVTTDKKGVITLSMNVTGVGISAYVRITMFGSTNQATATVEPNLSSNRITLFGVVRPSSESTSYKGRSL